MKAGDLAQAEAECAVRFERVVPGAGGDVGGSRGDAVGAGVADDLGGGVEAHGLRIQQRAGEGGRVVAFQPG